ncbi:MAG: alpha/beta hydrolase [Streptosporangiaceae bacterium]|nr:alpha/beta hydrolase [Streptosporangiaceae bacterium]MBV9855191.1 alpha/beta hydrolase [Streptosporangiaceae bacterium]
MSTPTSLKLPEGVRRTTVETSRGAFAALEALPVTGMCELGPALLVPGYTGSKEDFLPVLGQLAAGGRRVTAVDMRGQHETPGSDDADAYRLIELGADIAALAGATGAVHLLGHSFGGLVTREAVLAGLPGVGSLTLMSSGPAGLTGPRAAELRTMLALLGDDIPDQLRARVQRIWYGHLEPQAISDGVPAPIVSFLRERMLRSSPSGLAAMGRLLLSAPDRTAPLARLGGLVSFLVVYGEDDNAWSPAIQEDMATRLHARRACIPGAAHSPAVEAPASTAHELTAFWNATEGVASPVAAS